MSKSQDVKMLRCPDVKFMTRNEKFARNLAIPNSKGSKAKKESNHVVVFENGGKWRSK